MAFETGYKSTLAVKLNPGDTSMTVAVAPTITAGRLYLKSGSQEEWIDFTGVSGTTLTWLSRQLSKTSTPATSQGSGYTWIAGTPVRIVAMHDQMTWWNMDTSDFTPSAWSGSSITFSWTTYTREITPSENFSLVCGTVTAWMTYILMIHSGATAYTMSLWTGVTNPYGESLTLTANKESVLVLLATSNSTLQVWWMRTAI